MMLCQPRLPSAPGGMGYSQAINAMEALTSKMKGTTLRGRSTMLAIENPRMAVERSVDRNPQQTQGKGG